MANISPTLDPAETHPLEINRVICSSNHGSHTRAEFVDYDPNFIAARLTDLVGMFEEAAATHEVEVNDRLLSLINDLHVSINLPSEVYVDGDGAWCCDWYADDSDRGLYTCHTLPNKLLVVADRDNGMFSRLPCDLSNEDDPLADFRYAYSRVFGTKAEK